MKKSSYNLLRGKIARTVNAIVYDHMMRHYDEPLTGKQMSELMKYAKAGALAAMHEADERIFKEFD